MSAPAQGSTEIPFTDADVFDAPEYKSATGKTAAELFSAEALAKVERLPLPPREDDYALHYFMRRLGGGTEPTHNL